MEACQSLHLNQLSTNQSSASKYWTHARKYHRDPCRLSFTQRACSQASHNYVKMRKRMRNGADPRNGYGDKMQNRTDLDKIASFLRFRVLDLCLFL
jgi:hypothetical protein